PHNDGEALPHEASAVTDGNLPIPNSFPGSSTATFTGGTVPCLTPPTAASGFTITPFANGFVAQNFFFGGINFVGCPGASNPAFDPSSSLFVADFPNGTLSKLAAAG